MGFHPDMGVQVFDLYPTHPITGLKALGIGKRGPIWPVMGGSQPQGDPAGAGNIQPPANPPAPPPPSGNNDPDDSDKGFPAQTPWREMNPEQQVNYWKYHDRQKSNTLSAYDGITPEQAKEFKRVADEQRRGELQPSERALEDARTQAAATARTESDQRWAAEMTEVVVGQFVEDPQQRASVLAGLNPSSFLSDGKFDRDKLVGHMTGLATAFGGAPAGGQPRQWGQGGDRPPPPSAVDEGLAEARRRGFIT